MQVRDVYDFYNTWGWITKIDDRVWFSNYDMDMVFSYKEVVSHPEIFRKRGNENVKRRNASQTY